ncbi:hypothetical protein SP19_45 [Salmonella phage 19]|nr:hypothetical protein SP19_45 [Salmonella phage 19]
MCEHVASLRGAKNLRKAGSVYSQYRINHSPIQDKAVYWTTQGKRFKTVLVFEISAESRLWHLMHREIITANPEPMPNAGWKKISKSQQEP